MWIGWFLENSEKGRQIEKKYNIQGQTSPLLRISVWQIGENDIQGQFSDLHLQIPKYGQIWWNQHPKSTIMFWRLICKSKNCKSAFLIMTSKKL